MSRRKICLPQINANKDISVNKEFLQGEFENLTMGEVIVNVSPENTSLIVVNDGDEPSVFEPSNVIETKFSELFENSHQHSNKDVLDNITSDNVESWNNLIQSAHTHENKTILDSLTEDVINSWNNGEENVIENITLNLEKLPVANKTVNIDLSDYLKEVPSEYAKTEEIQTWVNEKVDGKFDAVGSADAAEAAAKADAAEKYQVKGNYEAAGAAAAVEGNLDAHKKDTVMHVTAQEKTDWNAAKSAIDTFLADADMTENAVDTLRELQSYMTTEGEAAAELVNKVSALEAIDHNAYISADTQVLADAKADAAEKYQPKGEYEAAGAAATAKAEAIDSAKTWVESQNYVTDTELNNKKYATETWVENKGYLTSVPAEYAKKTEIPSLDGYATQTWVENKSYLTSVPAEYVTETELQNKGYLTEHQDITGKQDVISDLEDIRSGAAKGATALQSVPAEYVTETELTNKGYATQTWVENKKYLTSHQDISGKQDVISDLDTIRSGAAKGATALQSVPDEYVTETELTNKKYATETWVENKSYLTSVPSKYVDSDELATELESYMTIVGAGQLSTEIYGNISASVITSVESAQTWVNNQNFLKSISLSSSTGKTYLVGKDSKTGSTTSLTTSTDDVYMEDGELYATSDERLKDFGDNISVDLDKLSEIPKAYYTWKTKPQGRKMIGLSAQKIGALYPEVVSTDENGKMAVSYEKLSVIALAAIDELHKENEELKNRLKRIEEKLGL